ncbi:FMN-binding domain-containing protein [Candidatus Kryptonium thompsonii]|jgi:Na+-translocating ferredoxin:NAD+ oxidoreductase RnfG subunit|uniref:FMN-binding domain-containing protein n=1 Tax=Candidatus Kryptonium thompsonii TaxID=1633631 RepID=A0A0N7MPU5_9BACT|nr:FMN-binding protein [Candidatus Kryptonium thompsoni]CUS80019.1 FMN-binding domain-containing protein [Candidatus Kryptonium thompsoni]CUS82547.1 FMN-binding domain-containing protein [Candidatus Kryptonium thompsoni]CUS84560.1 FMN-binding domain-containing protein [Candidatus Kryptonium thompsoni]CUS87817.1 FMN-binding domain-containing protein [Candidatus Kryptonium thompsoni]CUS89492.1 FMN-binding domain-containing protein [Candidatus Kryptonium thompsoni]
MINLLLLILFLLIQGKKPEQVLSEIYPNAKIEIKNIVISDSQAEKVKELSGVKVETKLITFYIVKVNSKVKAYAYVDIHVVRTHPEVVLYVLNERGEIELIQILSFKEPPEYKADENWLNYLKGKTLGKDLLKLRKDVPNMTGATLTARAITDNARKVIALWKIIFEEGK